MTKVVIEDMKTSELRKVASLFDAVTAYRLAACLEAELIPTEVVSISALRWDILVPLHVVARAHSILKISELSEAELSYLATGKLAGDGDNDS